MRVEYGGSVLYHAQPRQWLFHQLIQEAARGRVSKNFLYGGAAGGGKTEALLWVIWYFATNPEYPKLSIGVFRKTFPEVEKYFINRALDVFPNPTGNPVYKYFIQKHAIKFLGTGTVVEFNQCEHLADVYKHQGAAWDILLFDELTHFFDFQIKYLRTRNRPSRGGAAIGFRPFLIAATNPGNVGHATVKRLWVDKNDYQEGEGTAEDYVFIPAKVWDNKYIIENDPRYVEKLKALPEMERRALLEGDWNIFAGQYFGEIRDELHGFDIFEISASWSIFIAFDYGFFPHPASVGWYAVDHQGNIYRYKELLVQKHTFEQLARKIISMCTEEEKRAIAKEYVVGPPDIFAKRGNAEGKSGEEEMQEIFDEVGWVMVRADNDRINGWRLMRQFLEPRKIGEKAIVRLKVARSCRMWWQSVPQLQHDPNRPEDVRKVGVTEEGKITDGDDCGDETRYALMSRFDPPQEPKKEREVDRYGAPIQKKKARGVYRGMETTEGKIIRPIYKGFQRQ